jgi:hypothetical protein
MRELDAMIAHDVGRVGVERSTDPAYAQLRNAGPKFLENLKVVQSRISTNRVYVNSQVSGNMAIRNSRMPNYCAGYMHEGCAV